MAAHLRTHEGLLPFLCPIPGCGKAFNVMCNLKTHIQIHDKDKTYPCTVPGCHEAFKRQRKLNEHLSGVHNIRRKTGNHHHLPNHLQAEGHLMMHQQRRAGSASTNQHRKGPMVSTSCSPQSSPCLSDSEESDQGEDQGEGEGEKEGGEKEEGEKEEQEEEEEVEDYEDEQDEDYVEKKGKRGLKVSNHVGNSTKRQRQGEEEGGGRQVPESHLMKHSSSAPLNFKSSTSSSSSSLSAPLITPFSLSLSSSAAAATTAVAAAVGGGAHASLTSNSTSRSSTSPFSSPSFAPSSSNSTSYFNATTPSPSKPRNFSQVDLLVQAASYSSSSSSPSSPLSPADSPRSRPLITPLSTTTTTTSTTTVVAAGAAQAPSSASPIHLYPLPVFPQNFLPSIQQLFGPLDLLFSQPPNPNRFYGYHGNQNQLFTAESKRMKIDQLI